MGFILVAVVIILLSVLVLFSSSSGSQSEPRAKAVGLAEKKREEIRAIYPSDMSYRGFICDTKNTFPVNTIVYLVAEGEYLYIIADEDMKLKLQIPFDSLSDVKVLLSHKDFYKEDMANCPDVEPIMVIYQFCYKNSNESDNFYFILGGGQISRMYNKTKWTKKSTDSYIFEKMRKTPITSKK